MWGIYPFSNIPDLSRPIHVFWKILHYKYTNRGASHPPNSSCAQAPEYFVLSGRFNAVEVKKKTGFEVRFVQLPDFQISKSCLFQK